MGHLPPGRCLVVGMWDELGERDTEVVGEGIRREIDAMRGVEFQGMDRPGT